MTEELLLTRLRETAKDVLLMAATGGMPDTFWMTDRRILRACQGLGWTPQKARYWARKQVS